MRANTSLWVALAVVGVLFVLSKTKQGEAIVASAADSIGAAVRGIRNNNPLNVVWGADWLGLVPREARTDPTYAQFAEMKYGVRAAAIVLRNYQRLHNLNTVDAIIRRWSTTDQDAYVANVAAYLGVSPSDPLNLEDRGTVRALIKAQARQEVGAVAAILVTDAAIEDGLNLAGFV